MLLASSLNWDLSSIAIINEPIPHVIGMKKLKNALPSKAVLARGEGVV